VAAQDVCLISGLVTDESNVPIAMARVFVTASPVALPDIAALTGEDGVFRFSVAAAGHYTIGCAADGFSPATATVLASPGQESEVVFRLAANSAR
jgi:hypothetical protein